MRYVAIAVLGLSLCALLANAGCTGTVLHGTVQGTVTSAANPSLRIQGATITLYRGTSVVARAVSDSEGQYRIASVEGGRYSIECTAPGYQTLRYDGVEVPASATTVRNFPLQPAEG